MKGVVDSKTRHKRSKLLRGLSAKKRHAFYQSQLRKTKTVLFESENKAGYIQGFTDNYVKIRMPWNPSYQNQLMEVSLNEIDDTGFVRIQPKEVVV